MSDKLRPVWKDGIETCKHGGWVGWCVRCKDEQIAALKREIVILKKNTMYFDAEVGKYRCIHCKATLETFGALAHKAGCPLLAQEQE